MTFLNPLQADQVKLFIAVAQRVFDKALMRFQHLPDWPRSIAGGYACIADASSGLPLLLVPVGVVLPTQQHNAVACLEKVQRLAQNHRQHLHVSSWQSRDPEARVFGGAVLVGSRIISFDSFSESGNEVVALAIAYGYNQKFGPESLVPLSHIASLSGNPLWPEMLEILPELWRLASAS